MTAAILYTAMMALSGYIAFRLFDGLRAGMAERAVRLGPRWHVRLRREPLAFFLMMTLWLGALVFICLVMGGMSYGFWTGRWAQP